MAIETVRRDNPPPLDPVTHPQSFAFITECLDKRDKERERKQEAMKSPDPA
jgi:hypothetical protein